MRRENRRVRRDPGAIGAASTLSAPEGLTLCRQPLTASRKYRALPVAALVRLPVWLLARYFDPALVP
ncbi:hypothetical protein CBM2637_A120151 [Cupriavidus taiwanensis]|nr:hypothetical protein CBM2637_A120151 [Cupriavidus taiwanensis]SPA49218.1 protein of unknown function [Cupriavidus taiwanensis]